MKKLILLILLAMLFSLPCNADNEAASVEMAVPEDVRELTGDLDGVSDVGSFFERLFVFIKNTAAATGRGVLKKAIAVILIALLCALLSLFSDESSADYVPLCGCAAIAVLCVSDTGSYTRLASDTINSISIFSKTLLPALCTLTAAGGQVSSAAVRYAATALCMDVFVSAAEKLILPVIYAYLAVGIACCAFRNTILESLAALLKWLSKTVMTVFAAGFSLYVGLSSAIASSGDAVAVRATKTVISTVLPVVGGILSDAASSVVAGAQLLKTSVGVLGMFTVLAVCIGPLVVLGCNLLAFKAASAVVTSLGTSQLAKLTGTFGTVFGMLAGLVGCCGLIVFISVISCLRAVAI